MTRRTLSFRTLTLAAAPALALASGCQPSLTPEGVDGGPATDAFFAATDGAIPPVTGNFTHERQADGSVITTVDATSTEAWHYLDLDTGLAVTPTDASTDHTWDLAFQRFLVLSNGGASGSGGGLVARVTGQSFASVTQAPETGWIADAPDGDDRDSTNDSAFVNGTDDWYLYDETSHLLTARTDVVYVVETPDRTYFKVQILGYYDGAGTPGFLRFQWAPVEAPSRVEEVDGGTWPDAGSEPDAGVASDAGPPVPSDAITIDASSRTELVYFDLETMSVVAPADPGADTTWDLALQRVLLQTNSGSSGPGLGGVVAHDGVAYDDVTVSGTLGFTEDALDSSSGTEVSTNGALGAWYDYDLSTHTVTPKDITYVVRTTEGGYFKLRIWTWSGGIFQLSAAPIDVSPETVALTLDASTSGTWAYLDLHSGSVVSVADPATDAVWDVGFSRTLARTSSGTSGPGTGGALDSGEADFATLVTLPTDGFTVDSELTSSSPGGGTFSGNGVLGAWYSYDPATHVVSPLDTTFVIRLSDGTLGKLEVQSYASGVYTLGWSYAGPGRAHF